MPFYCGTDGGQVAQPTNLKTEGYICIDFLQCARRDVNSIRWRALEGEWAIRECAKGDVGVRNSVLGLVMSLPGGWVEIVSPSAEPKSPSPFLDLRAWVPVTGPLPKGPRERGNIVVREEGELTQSHNWVLPMPSYYRERDYIQRWTGILQNPVNLARWYTELFGEALEPEEQPAVESEKSEPMPTSN